MPHYEDMQRRKRLAAEQAERSRTEGYRLERHAVAIGGIVGIAMLAMRLHDTVSSPFAAIRLHLLGG